MGSGAWFRWMICLGKNRSKEGKVHSSTENSNGGNRNHSTPNGNRGSHTDPSSSRRILENKAATRIQRAFRTYRARKMFRRQRGTERFNNMMQGQTVQKQILSALSCIHSWSNIQAQINNRRLCMVTEGRIRQKKLENQLKVEAKLHELEVEWHNGSETMEEILSRIQQKEEAAIKRERAMAYAFSHQWRANSSQYMGQAYYSIGKENWGWSWTERWITARPWEVRVNSKPTKTKKLQLKSNRLNNTDKQDILYVSAMPASSNSNGYKITTKSRDGLL